MKSSDIKSSNINSSSQKIDGSFLVNSPGYSLLVLYMPLTTLLALIVLVGALLAVDLPSVLLIVNGGIGALAASFYCDFMKDIKSSRLAANIRGGIIIAAVSYFFTSLFLREIRLDERFIPNPINIIASVCAIYSWGSVISLKQLFSARKYFESITETYQGEQLQIKLFEESSLMQFTSEKINKTMQNYFFQLGIIGVLTISSVAFSIQLPLTFYVFLIFLLAGGVCIFGLFEIIKWEHYYANEGIGLSSQDRIKRILAIAVFSLAGLTAAFLLASDKNIFSISIIAAFFTWLFSLLRRFSFQYDNTDFTENFLSGDSASEFYLPEHIEPSPIWETIIKYGSIILKYGLIALAIILFIRFMISPLLNRGDVSGKMSFSQRLVKIITEWFKSTLAAIASFIAELKSGRSMMKLRKYNAEEICRTAETLLNAYSPAKKSDIRKSVTLFAQLIIWGSEVRGVTWKPFHAPGEYCSLLANAAPDEEKLNSGIIRCGELFEKALYSAEVLSDGERKEFRELVEEITSNAV